MDFTRKEVDPEKRIETFPDERILKRLKRANRRFQIQIKIKDTVIGAQNPRQYQSSACALVASSNGPFACSFKIFFLLRRPLLLIPDRLLYEEQLKAFLNRTAYTSKAYRQSSQ